MQVRMLLAFSFEAGGGGEEPLCILDCLCIADSGDVDDVAQRNLKRAGLEETKARIGMVILAVAKDCVAADSGDHSQAQAVRV